MKISASSAQINGITISVTSGKGTTSTKNLVVTSGGGTLMLATDGSTAATWSGTSSSVTITDDATNGRDIDITGLSVTYTTTSGSYKSISVEDLRIKHDAHNPTRTLGGFTLTTSNWKAYNENATSYKLLHSDKSSGYTSSLSIALDQTNIDAGAKITQVVLVGEANTFSGVEVDAENNSDAAYTHTTTDEDQIVWTNTDGATTATIKLKTNTADARPSFSQIWIYTNKNLTYSKADATLTFSPNCSSATVNTAYEFTDITTSPTDFRFDSRMTSDGGTGTTFNGYGLSTGKFTGTAGSSNGDVTIQAYFDGNDLFNAVSANHHLVVVGEAKTAWDFTTETEAIDVLNMEAGNDWTKGTGNVYTKTEIASASALTANSIPMLLTDGLTFKG